MTKPRARWKGILAWTLAVVCVAWFVSWRLGRPWMLGDLIAAWQAQALVLVIAAGAACLLLRRVRAAVVVGSVAVCSIGPYLGGRSFTLPEPDLARPPAEGSVRVVTLNIDPRNERWAEDLERVFGWHPDVIVLIESSPDMWRAIVRYGFLEGGEWPHHERRAWVGDLASPCFVLSRWPMERLAFPSVPDAERDLLVARVDRPVGSFLIAPMHPHSPRSLDRWRLGNAQVETTMTAFGIALEESGLPLLVGADLNSGPAGLRASWLRDAGLMMSKPFAGGWGSYPASVPGPARVQLDDVWRTGDVRVVAWGSVGGLGGDHRAVVVDAVFDR